MDWIKIEEKLPESNIECLTTIKVIYNGIVYYEVEKLKYDLEEGWMYENWDGDYFVGWTRFANRYDEDTDKVIAWVPYPKPYEE